MAPKNVHVALLRGINVGKAKRVAMADLRRLVEDLGYRDVRTILNSGNVVFSSGGTPKSSAAKIEKALLSHTGISSRITGLAASEHTTIIDDNPFDAAIETPSRFLIAVVREETTMRKIEPLSKLSWGSERLALGRRAVYVWAPQGILESGALEAISKAAGDGITIRNWSTLGKIAAAARGIGGEATLR